MLVLGFLAARASALEPPVYSPPSSFQLPHAANGNGHAVMQGACGSTCEGAGDERGRRGDRLSKLIDFLLYRPTPGCDCCPQTTSYVPPLHAWFPPCCHANGQNGCASCAKCGLKKLKGGGDCATCGPTAGAPVHIADTKPVLVEKSPVVATRAMSHGIPTTTIRPQSPAQGQAATRYWMPGVPSSTDRATPYSPSAPTPSTDGYKIQPSNYLPPLPPQR
jgi:hypothetical protein